MLMKKIRTTVEKTRTGYSAFADTVPVFTTGDTLRELTHNMVEALRFYYNNPKVTERNLEIRFSIPSFFDLYPINIRQFASRIEMNYTLLSHYVQGRKVPSSKQANRILEGLREMGEELTRVTFR